MANNREEFIKALQRGETVQFRGAGNSMTPRIYTGDMLTVEPIKDYTKLKKDDAVLCKVKGSVFVHKIYATDGKEPNMRFQIGNNHGHINGWAYQKHVYGLLVNVTK